MASGRLAAQLEFSPARAGSVLSQPRGATRMRVSCAGSHMTVETSPGEHMPVRKKVCVVAL